MFLGRNVFVHCEGFQCIGFKEKKDHIDELDQITKFTKYIKGSEAKSSMSEESGPKKKSRTSYVD